MAPPLQLLLALPVLQVCCLLLLYEVVTAAIVFAGEGVEAHTDCVSFFVKNTMVKVVIQTATGQRLVYFYLLIVETCILL